PVGDVRGRGLMIGIELVKDRQTKERAPIFRNELVQACFRRGLLVLPAGPSAVRLSPPLLLRRPQVESALSILDEALQEVRR
ncbi:MAG TPA: aminotransferase class III-fold pyridoxal phosphate-dependent enzyme, partial [Candidatus Deferrimicrobiaceae bacterium]